MSANPMDDVIATLFRPSSTGRWLESISPILAAQQAEERDFERYCAQRDMGFSHDCIARFFTSRNAGEFPAWYAAERRP